MVKGVQAASKLASSRAQRMLGRFSNWYTSMQGVMMMPSKAVPAGAEGQALYKRLWIHEVMRVFHDRLVDTPDRSWLLKQVCGLLCLWLSSDCAMEGV